MSNAHAQYSGSADVSAFEVDVFVSGYASSHRAPEFASRSQRAFIRVAKGFAALPKLVADAAEDVVNPPLSASTEQLLKSVQLPPRPDEMTSEEAELKALEQRFRQMTTSDDEDRDDASSTASGHSPINEVPPIANISTSNPVADPTYTPSEIQRFHANLEARLQPFWSSVLSSRQVRIRLFTSVQSPVLEKERTSHDEPANTPVANAHVTTAADGSFQVRFRIKWEDMCQHPGALHIAFGSPLEEHELLVVADLLAPPSNASATPASAIPRDQEPDSYFSSPNPLKPVVVTSTQIVIPLTHSPIRVISDIDDTIKFSSILGGARSVFRNVFVKELSDTIIPGMGDWYSEMWSKGVRFHYVSNGPFELLPVIREFFQISHLPPGSIKLRSYAGRSIFDGFLTAPASRKRAGVEDILNSFPDSRFFLIGDTGEQDLELYAEIARDRPEQIIGIFLRDADDSYSPLEDPTGINAIFAIPSASTTRSSASTRSFSSSSLKQIARGSSSTSTTFGVVEPTDRFTAAPESYAPVESPNSQPGKHRVPASSKSSLSYTPRRSTATSISSTTGGRSQEERMNFVTYKEHPAYTSMSDVEKKRCDLQMRVYKARVVVPDAIPLRVFRDPRECEEAQRTLKREGL